MVISDSHGNVPALTAALDWARQAYAAGSATDQNHAQELAAAVFLGDGSEDLAAASAQAGFAVPWYKVRGNGDFNFSIPDTLVLEAATACQPAPKGSFRESSPESSRASRKLFLAHGNRHGVDGGGKGLAAAARAAGAEAALFGHTHAPHCSVLEGIFLLNPGSIGRSRSSAGPTFAVLECPAAGPLRARFFRLVNRGKKTTVEELKIQ